MSSLVGIQPDQLSETTFNINSAIPQEQGTSTLPEYPDFGTLSPPWALDLSLSPHLLKKIYALLWSHFMDIFKLLLISFCVSLWRILFFQLSQWLAVDCQQQYYNYFLIIITITSTNVIHLCCKVRYYNISQTVQDLILDSIYTEGLIPAH